MSEQVDRRIAVLMAARSAALADSDARLAAYRADLAGFDGDLRLRQDLSGAWSRLRTSANAAIRSAFNARIAAVRALRHAAADSGDLDAVDIDALGEPDVGIVSSLAGTSGVLPIVTLAGFEGERRGEVVRYWSRSDRTRAGQPALVDAGAIIWVNDRSDRAIEAAVMLGRERFGHVAVFGDAAYLDRCRDAAKRLGIEVETISVHEAGRRARRTRQRAASAREWALNMHRGDRADIGEQRLAWARAYRRAGVDSADQLDAIRPGEVLHHSAISAMTTMLESVVTKEDPAPAQRRTPPIPEPGRDR